MDNKEILESTKDYVFLKNIGEGTYGKVWLIQEKNTDNKYILKVVKVNKQTSILVNIEIEALEYIKNICNPYLLCLKSYKMYKDFALIILDYIENSKDLFEFLQEKFLDMKIKEKLYIANQLVKGLNQLHSANVVHRDIKPENILIDSKNNVRYIDFGYACREQDKKCLEIYVGTPMYFSPRLAKRYSDNRLVANFNKSKQDDIWALGITFVALFYGSTLWDTAELRDLIYLTSETDYESIKNQLQIVVETSESVDSVIVGLDIAETIILPMLNPDEDSRVKIEELQNDIQIMYNKYS